MKLFGTKPLGLALVMAALFLSVSSRAFGYVISAYPDSVVMTATVGNSTIGYVNVSENWDTLNGEAPQMTIHASLSGGSQFTFASDSVITFRGSTYVEIQYSPASDFTSWGELAIVGDSNTVYVQLIGNPMTHSQPQITVGNYDSIQVNQQTCENFSVYNPNPDTIWVSQVLITDDPRPGTQWSLDSLLSSPVPIRGHSSSTLGEICAYVAASDSNLSINGSLKIIYSYGLLTDSVSTGLEGRAWENATCVTSSNGYFGTVEQGTSVTKTITLTNTTDTSIYLYSTQIVGANAGEFTLNSPSFPLVIPMDSSVNVSITFSSNASQGLGISANFEADVYGMSPDDVPCVSLSVPLYVNVQIPVTDTITLDVPPDGSTLSITAHTANSRHAIFIHNIGSNLLVLQDLSATSEDTGAWATFEPNGGSTAFLYNDSVAAGATVSPTIMDLNAVDTGTYNLDLTLMYEIQQAHQKGKVPTSSSYTYTVVAHRLPPVIEAVSEPNAPATTEFALMPNPTRDEVTIVLPDNGASTVEIYDVLGNLVMHKVAQGNFVWNGETGAGPLANGTYIVRVSQGDHTSSKRLVIVR